MSHWTELFGAELLTKDGLKPSAEVLSGKSAIGIYFSAHWCPPCRGFTPKLAESYTDSLKGKGMEIVFVSSDKNQGAFDEYYGEQPWVSLPYNAREMKDKLSKKYKVQGIPSFIILDSEGKTITSKGREMIATDPKGEEYPWKPKSLKEIMGDSVQAKDGSSVPMSSLDNKVLGLYFSAKWCPPCQAFTPKLIETYEKLQKEGKQFEIIYCSSDRDEEGFKEYYGKMPWMCIPFEDRKRKQALGSHFDVSGIPSLVILDENRDVITTNGVAPVRSGKGEFPWAPLPVREIDEDAEGIDEAPSLVMLLENVDADKQKDIVSWLSEIATPYLAAAKKSGDDPEFYFFVATSEGGLSERVRDECSFEDKSGPACILMDIQDNGGYYTGPKGVDVSKDNIVKLLEDYKSKSLKREQMG